MALFSSWFILELLGTIFVILAGVYVYFKYVLYDYWRKKGVYYLEPTVPFGNLADILLERKSLGKFFEAIYSEHKSNRYLGIYSIYKPTLVITDPDLVRFILTKEFASFHDRGQYLDEKVDPLANNLFFLPGAKWKNLRVKLTPTYTSGKMKQIFHTMQACCEELTAYLETVAPTKVELEIKEILARLTVDVITSTAFGITCNSIKNPNNEFSYWGRYIFMPRRLTNALMILAPKILEIFSMPFTHKGVTKFFTKAFEETVTYRIANNVTRYDFLNLIMQLMKKGYVDKDDGDDNDDVPHLSENADGKISMLEGCAQAFVFFAAGFETSSSTGTYTLYELAFHQDIQQKVHDEIDRTLEKHGTVTYDAINDMPYLHKVVSETLRKHPPLPFLNRVCTKDIDLPTTNLSITKGTDIVIPVLGLHRDPDHYPDPEKYDPERFNETNIASRHPYTYLPFGEGPRVCIGMRFGLMQTKAALISLLRKFKVSPGPNTPTTLHLDPAVLLSIVRGGIPLCIEPRSTGENMTLT